MGFGLRRLVLKNLEREEALNIEEEKFYNSGTNNRLICRMITELVMVVNRLLMGEWKLFPNKEILSNKKNTT